MPGNNYLFYYIQDIGFEGVAWPVKFRFRETPLQTI
jgi:hypothetical protein